MAENKNGTPGSPGSSQEAVVARVIVSPKGAAVTETALVLSDAALAQLVIKAPVPSRSR